MPQSGRKINVSAFSPVQAVPRGAARVAQLRAPVGASSNRSALRLSTRRANLHQPSSREDAFPHRPPPPATHAERRPASFGIQSLSKGKDSTVPTTDAAMLRTILLVLLILLILGALPLWPYSTGWGYYPSGGGLLLLIILLLLLFR